MKKILKWIGIIILFFYLIGWIAQLTGNPNGITKPVSTNTTEKSESENDEENSDMKSSELIYKSNFKGDWPFTKDTIKVFCENKAIWLVTYPEGRFYQLNGYSKAYLENKLPDTEIHNLSEIQIKYKSNGYFLDLGKTLCF
jgi:hypothetical protein